MKKILFATAALAVSLASISVAQAADFPATPMNPGPMVVTGMGPIGDIANVALIPTNAVTQVVTSVGAPAPMPVSAPMMMKHHHHHHHMMMK